jgi:hypothetical protein
MGVGDGNGDNSLKFDRKIKIKAEKGMVEIAF